MLTLIEVAVGGFQDAMRGDRTARGPAAGGALLMLGLQQPQPDRRARQRRDRRRLVARQKQATPPRTYLGGSRLGHACERALQFEF